MSSFALKIIAIVSMLCDHSGYIIFGGSSFMNYIGRIAFPIYAFLLAKGYTYTKSVSKYVLRLCFFAVISQLPFILFIFSISGSFDNSHTNILFTLLLGLFSIILFDRCKNKLIGILLAGVTVAFGNIIKCDYGTWGVALIFLFFLCRNNKVVSAMLFFCMLAIKYSGSFFVNTGYIFGYLIALIIILMYNEKQGKKTLFLQYGIYAVYPVHMLILCIIAFAIG